MQSSLVWGYGRLRNLRMSSHKDTLSAVALTGTLWNLSSSMRLHSLLSLNSQGKSACMSLTIGDAVPVWSGVAGGCAQPANLPHHFEEGLPPPWHLPLAPQAELGWGGGG